MSKQNNTQDATQDTTPERTTPAQKAIGEMTADELRALTVQMAAQQAAMQDQINALQEREKAARRERRTERINLIFRPSVVAKCKKAAHVQAKSFNDFMETAALAAAEEVLKGEDDNGTN